ncbi:T9SS type A sorting domain-containing protein [Microscilla marina]|uniref:Lipoprotein, putative n=1 Tax=Microscilla marina ATCC 23134 TaxID=313606 RepID=A1ZZ09_MICM2|nr:T9SS type A sorting domain-containing protein [Microscilla marina]EAY24389.1 lipoprotein, putative [Microscilla marina ATCC 23134]
MKKNTQNIQRHRLWIVLLLSISCIANGWSQLTVKPHYASRASKTQLSRANLRTTQTTLTLPFLDDFTSSKKTDTVWQKNVGVFINNTLGIKPPTIGVASFDGVDGSGIPYDISSSTSQGGADTLVSCPIDLSVQTPADNIYLSFYWQAQGLGEFPDNEDSLQLQLKDVNGDWVSIWSQMGGDNLTNLPTDYTKQFKQEIFAISDPKYFHNNFQFRFIAFARTSGSYDTWNLDYVFLDKNRHINDFGQSDIVISEVPNSFLKRYSAMPFNQYLANAADETAATISTKATNLNGSGFTLHNYDCVLEDTQSNAFISTLVSVVPAPLLNAGASQQMEASVSPSLLDPFKNNAAGVKLKYTFRSYLEASNRNDIDQNDTISRVTVLTDYYAYDDGSAEFLAGVNQNRGQVAYRYVVNEPDTLTDVQMYVARLNKDLTGQTFIFKVWNNKNGKPDSVLLQKIVSVTDIYAPNINEFVSVKAALEKAFDKFIPIKVTDTVFVGWQQTNDDMLTVGLDKNTESSDQIYSNLLGEWIQNTDSLGSLMVRPVFGKAEVVGLAPKIDPKQVNIYPNPNHQGRLHIEGLVLKQIHVLTLQGQVVKTLLLKQNTSQRYVMDIDDLPPGTYLLHCRDHRNRAVAKRVVILK